ncbi:FAD-dependent oxidoreductase [Leucobacter sp. W1038]|uniref:FAD-dependent oxidoreductase n=1 Tax=Leucobacter sp. W1038 TaxID=3438281 RepID=UPI003D984065
MSTRCDFDVIVVGAGPTGLLVASELQRHGISVGLLERRADPWPGTRAIGVHAPVLAALEASGATERILSEATRVTRGIARSGERTLGEVRFNRLRTRFPFVATVPQAVTEAAVATGGPDPLRGRVVVSLAEEGDRVVVTHTPAAAVSLAGSTPAAPPPDTAATGELTARAVVVAAGASGRGLVSGLMRVAATEYPDRYLMADVAGATAQPADTAVIHLDQAGVLESFPLPHGGRRLVAWDAGIAAAGIALARQKRSSPGHAALAAAGPDGGADDLTGRLRSTVASRTGDEGLASLVSHASSFGIRRVLLRRMRAGRILAIGDTAHEVSPIGGQGMNLGLLDAATLAPVLSRCLSGGATTRELDRWERTRLASARTAARLAHLNTSLGRPRSAFAHSASTRLLGGVLGSPLERVAARAYAMGFDRDAATTPRGPR